MYHLEHIDEKPLVERVVDNIVSYIVDNKVSPGSKLPNEFELASQFGVGRSTIREAIKMLSSKGVLEVKRGSGTFVANKQSATQDPLGLSMIKDRYKLALDLVTVRLLLEPEIAALAAKNATEEEIIELEKLCNMVESVITSGDNHIQYDIEFHASIARCSKNTVVTNLVPMINSSVAVFANITHRSLREETIQTHRQVFEAIRNHDSTSAKYAMTMHLLYNRNTITTLMNEAEEHAKKNL